MLLHGWLDSLRCFKQLMAVLPERIRAFAFDQRGHGDAGKPAGGYGLGDFADDVGTFMDAVGLEAAVLVGASSGGYVAQRFAVDNPDRALGLALLGSPRSLRGPRPRFADVLASLKDPIQAALARELSEGMVGREVPEAVMATLCEENLKVPARVWRDAFEGLLAAEPPLDTGRISAPTLIVWGARLAAPARRPGDDGGGDPRRAAGGLCRRRPPAGSRGARARRRRPHRTMRRGRRALEGNTQL